jgi:uncharacterized membrane protein
MLGTLLAFINPLSTILGQIQQWEAKLLDAKTEQERIAAQERIGALQAQASVAGHPLDAIVRALFAAPFLIYLWKLVLWDKIITAGTGSTDDLSNNLWYVAMVIVGFYFLHWTVGRFTGK